MIRTTFAALIALGAAAALLAAADAASDGGAQEPPAVARQQQQARPTGDNWSCRMTIVRGPRAIDGFWRGRLDHIHYEISKREVCTNSATNATWNGPVTRVTYWQCQNAQRELVACPG